MLTDLIPKPQPKAKLMTKLEKELLDALKDLVEVIQIDDLIPDSVSYMKIATDLVAEHAWEDKTNPSKEKSNE